VIPKEIIVWMSPPYVSAILDIIDHHDQADSESMEAAYQWAQYVRRIYRDVNGREPTVGSINARHQVEAQSQES
jgi:hypothetical protein